MMPHARVEPLLDQQQHLVQGSSREHNQWDVPGGDAGILDRLYILGYYVMCRGCCMPQSGKHPRSLLGDYGHIERLPAWSHLIAALAFLGYAVSCSVRFSIENVVGAWAVAASWLSASAFLTSTIYHVASPDLKLSAVLRQLDFSLVYGSISTSALADLAAVTSGFRNVPVSAIVDVPIAAISLASFFLWRRSWLTLEDTMVLEHESFTVRPGLFRRWHSDGDHTPLRQAGSLGIAIAYFTSTPAIIANLGIGNAGVVLGLQVSAFVLVVLGMILDNLIQFPDYWLSRGVNVRCVAFRNMGCMLSHHSIWHLISIVSAIMAVVAREYAISVL
jgi:hypothetical protein